MGVGGDGVAKPEVMKGLPKMVEREGGRMRVRIWCDQD